VKLKKLLKHGCPLVINTSFNVRGEPLVCTPEEAYNCFMRTDMDYLVMGNFLLSKKEQDMNLAASRSQTQFEPD
jgi:carbamoyltransferase